MFPNRETSPGFKQRHGMSQSVCWKGHPAAVWTRGLKGVQDSVGINREGATGCLIQVAEVKLERSGWISAVFRRVHELDLGGTRKLRKTRMTVSGLC